MNSNLSQPDKIRIQRVRLTFPSEAGPVRVLDGIDLAIKEGEFVTVIGPSGCGKSTLMNLVSKTVEHAADQFEGTIDIAWRSNAAHRLGYVLQKDTLLPWRTLEANVGVGLEIMGMPSHEREAQVQSWIHRVGLAGFEKSYPFAMSGGMRQRANIIRTLACNPEVVLMDEPFGALDAQTRMTLQQLLIDLWHAAKTTILFVTHDVEESILLGNRVVLMSRRPAKIHRVFDIDIPHPRSVIDARVAPAFQDAYREIWKELKGDIELSQLKNSAAKGIA
ncbi:MAG: ABC transporter ATP-binding protein [Betaproteobacteria bacterium]|nr:MAG: ABC transporter ATP-binding protein [Betaproteobacteria bacterium]